MSTHRLISLLTSLPNIFEKVIYARLYQHIIINNILANKQFGFRLNSSPEKAACKLLTEILNGLNNTITVGGIFCDLEEAFNCVIMKFYCQNWNFMA
jgi:Reverse transcriptase (RNA-dependent DNA polymerase).